MRSYVDVVDRNNEITYWIRDENGLSQETVPASDYTYCYMLNNTGKETGWKNLRGEPVKRVNFEKKWDMRDETSGRDDYFETDVAPANRFIMENFPDKETIDLNVLYYDIEVAFDLEEGHGYPSPKNPFGEINLIQCFHSGKNQYAIFLSSDLKEIVYLEDDDYPVNMFWCDSERDMLERFADYIEDIDVMTAWFGAGFDLPYLMERALKLFDKSKALSLFCRDNFSATKRDFVNPYKEEVWEWQLIGRKHIDMMELYKKFIPSEQKSFKLDNIAEAELGTNKVEVDDGDLGKLYRDNPQKFCEYGLHDARILKQLDDKLQMVKLADVIAKSSYVSISDVLGAVKPIETAMLGFCHEKGIVLPDKTDNEKEKFDGAIVYDTISGRHGWGMSIDLGSLYPSVIMMLGLSPETIVMQCHGEYDDYVDIMSGNTNMISATIEEDGSVIELPANELKQIILDDGFTISANGTILTGEMGLFAEFTKYAFEKRKHYKDLMKSATNETDRNLYDLYQKVFKIFANSIYGVSGQVSFRLYDIRLSKSTTLTGQVVSKFQAYKTNELMKDVETLYE